MTSIVRKDLGDERLLPCMKSGKKVYEGRSASGKWASSVRVGDVVIFYTCNDEAQFRVLSLIRADNFGQLYEKLREKLLPSDVGVSCTSEAIDYYRQFYGDDVDKEAIGIEIEFMK